MLISFSFETVNESRKFKIDYKRIVLGVIIIVIGIMVGKIVVYDYLCSSAIAGM